MAKNIETLVLGASSELNAQPGDFATTVEAGKLLFPENVYTHLTNNGEYRTLLELVSAYDTFPSIFDGVARSIGWSRADVDVAYHKLLDSLSDYLPKEIFVRQPRRNYGEVIPSDWIGKTVEELEKWRNKN